MIFISLSVVLFFIIHVIVPTLQSIHRSVTSLFIRKIIEFTNCLLSSIRGMSLSSVKAISSIPANTSSAVSIISTSPPDSELSSAVLWGISRKTLSACPGKLIGSFQPYALTEFQGCA